MNNERYWIIRRRINKVDFNFRKIIYVFKHKISIAKSTSTFAIKVIKTLISQIVVSLIIALILFACDRMLVSMCINTQIEQKILNQIPISQIVNQDILITVIVGGMGIAGVILGLYCSNMASIYSARYVNAPNSLSEMFQVDIITSKCIRQIIRYIVLCLILLSTSILKVDLFLVSIIAIIIFTIRVMVTFTIAGNRTYHLSDTFKIVDSIYLDIYACFNILSKNDFFAEDRSFQAHFQKIVSAGTKKLEDISIYNKSNPQNQNAAMLNFMNRNLLLLYSYWGIKSAIHYDSFWFRNKVQYPQWHTSSDSSVEMALRTGTMIHPIEIKNYNWLEQEIEKSNNVCFQKLCNEADFHSIYTYLNTIIEISNSITDIDALEYLLEYLKNLQDKLLLIYTEENKEKIGSEDSLIAATVDSIIGIHINLVIGMNSYLDFLDLNQMYENAKQYNSFSEVNLKSNRFLNNKPSERLYRCIETELSIEHKRVTPIWFIEQTVAHSIYNYLNRILNAQIKLYDNVLEFGDNLLQKKFYFEAMVIYSRLAELDSKHSVMLNLLDKFIPLLQEKHFEKSIVWEESHIQELKEQMSMIKKSLPSRWIECSGIFALKHWDNREEYPDFLGFCYNHLCEYLIQALEENDFENFKIGYCGFFARVLVYQEYIRTDVIKTKEAHMQNAVFHVITAPFIEYAMISGLAILWGEFNRNNEWKLLVEKELADFVSKESKNIDILINLSELSIARKHHMLGIGNRDVLQTGWEIRLANAIRSSGLYEFEYTFYGKKILTDSTILKAFGSTDFNLIGISDSEDVYFAICVNKYLPSDKQYKTRYEWKEDSDESE